jgi:hypothetical protein
VRKISIARLHSRRDVKTSHDVRQCFCNKVHFVRTLSSGPHVTDLGKGPLRELDAARRAWVGIEEDPVKNAEVTRSVGQVLVTTKCPGRATLLSCLSLDGDPEQARCSIMRSSMCLANECISVQLNCRCALLELV